MAQCLAKFPQSTLLYDRKNAYAAAFNLNHVAAGDVANDEGVLEDMRNGMKVFANGKPITKNADIFPNFLHILYYSHFYLPFRYWTRWKNAKY